ncbi:MAG: hypothetical protein ABFS34_16815 [Gemmatimonadota bacterium]
MQALPKRTHARAARAAAAAILSLAPLTPATAQAPDGAEAEVLAAVQEFFDAMAARDSVAAADILIDEGVFFAVGTQDGVPGHTVSSHAAFARLVGQLEDPIIERMWDPEVLMHGPIAIVWAPYDLYRGDDFSHCGVDGFSLVRTPDGWKIAAIIFTRETEDCPDNPAGPLGGGS